MTRIVPSDCVTIHKPSPISQTLSSTGSGKFDTIINNSRKTFVSVISFLANCYYFCFLPTLFIEPVVIENNRGANAVDHSPHHHWSFSSSSDNSLCDIRGKVFLFLYCCASSRIEIMTSCSCPYHQSQTFIFHPLLVIFC